MRFVDEFSGTHPYLFGKRACGECGESKYKNKARHFIDGMFLNTYIDQTLDRVPLYRAFYDRFRNDNRCFIGAFCLRNP